jgi:endonuclease G, mitochondrial
MAMGGSRLRTYWRDDHLVIAINLIVLLSCVFTSGCGYIAEGHREGRPISKPPVWAPPASENPHLALGNPSEAKPDPVARDNYLILGEGSAISYNDTRGTANWISWKTTKAELGPTVPRPPFRHDPRLPRGFKPVHPEMYSGSGLDRGHLVPSSDRFASERLNEKTFYMTNIVPQSPALNRFPWERLEAYARGAARRGRDVYNISGCYGDAGRLKDRVTVPTNCWKVIVIVPGGLGITEIDSRANVIAVDMPNTEEVRKNAWRKYLTTPAELERRTGYRFFTGLSEERRMELLDRKYK